MIKTLGLVVVSLWLVLGVAGAEPVLAGAGPSAEGPAAESAEGQVILVAGGPFEGVDAIVNLEPPHLVALGLGIVGGATVISPTLGVGELIGVGLGVIAAEYLYRTFYEKRRFIFW